MPALEECLIRQLLSAVEGFIGSVAFVAEVPESATADGTAGQFAFDEDWLYICVATDTWRRVAIAAW
jgi:hypothetical protein